jgi:hypothetical protein
MCAKGADRKGRPPKAGRGTPIALEVTRAEFEHLVAAVMETADAVKEVRRELETQFRRIAQMQSELDQIRRASTAGRSER